jgi:hypothetical protein
MILINKGKWEIRIVMLWKVDLVQCGLFLISIAIVGFHSVFFHTYSCVSISLCNVHILIMWLTGKVLCPQLMEGVPQWKHNSNKHVSNTWSVDMNSVTENPNTNQKAVNTVSYLFVHISHSFIFSSSLYRWGWNKLSSRPFGARFQSTRPWSWTAFTQ